MEFNKCGRELAVLRTLKLTLLIIGLVILAGVFFAAGFGIARLTAPAPGPSQSVSGPDSFKIFWEAWGITEKNFVDPGALDQQKMTRGAVKGMLDSLGDPHSGFVDPQHYEFEQADLEGAFDGIGAHVGMRNEQLVVIAPLEGSPAQRAGIKTNDRIIQIDGKDASGMSVTEAVGKIRGPRGTKVILSILHEGERRTTDLEIVREQIKTPSVVRKVLPGDIGYLRLSFFTDNSKDELTSALNGLLQSQVKSLVLDLRNNPGGLLDQTIGITSQFLKDGVVAYQVDKDGKKVAYNVRSGGVATEIPMAVLVNKGSASASEILAGALQDRGRATIVGEQTFGKGSVNRFHQLSDGSAIYLTFARWVTPNGRVIEGRGLTPDILVSITQGDFEAGTDTQLDRAIGFLSTR